MTEKYDDGGPAGKTGKLKCLWPPSYCEAPPLLSLSFRLFLFFRSFPFFHFCSFPINSSLAVGFLETLWCFGPGFPF